VQNPANVTCNAMALCAIRVLCGAPFATQREVFHNLLPLPDWVRTSTDAVSKAFRLRRTGRQDLIDVVERGDMTLEAALEEAEAKEQPNQKGGGEV
jgi:hypothetical protein